VNHLGFTVHRRGKKGPPFVTFSALEQNHRAHPFQSESKKIMAKTRCNDRVVGTILASWRYDISGISPEMRKDYEHHLAECPRCKARQKFHRSFDVALFVLTATSVFFSVFALAVLMHIKPLEHVAFNILGLDISDMYHMLVSAAIAGVCFSVIAFALVMMATPVPTYLGGIAAERAKLIEDRLPDSIKSLRPR
jgi:hypothetical protein